VDVFVPLWLKRAATRPSELVSALKIPERLVEPSKAAWSNPAGPEAADKPASGHQQNHRRRLAGCSTAALS
jgi:hypothetical protein